MLTLAESLTLFTQRFMDNYQQTVMGYPCSQDNYGVPSPCIIKSKDNGVLWQPTNFTANPSLERVEVALDIKIRSELHEFYTHQFSGNFNCQFKNRPLILLQVWSEDDFISLQENLIGHLVTQRRLKRSPTLFIATLDDDITIISVCNLSGEVILETLNSGKREILASDLPTFLQHLSC